MSKKKKMKKDPEVRKAKTMARQEKQRDKLKQHKAVTEDEWKLRSEWIVEQVQKRPMNLAQLASNYARQYGPERPIFFKRMHFFKLHEQGLLPDIKWGRDGKKVLVSTANNGHAAPNTGRDPHYGAQSTGGPSCGMNYGGEIDAPQPRKLVVQEKYLLVSDRTSFERALETVCNLGARTLAQAISGTVALDLEGFNLGSEGGTLSMVQMMAKGWPVALLFDIMELNKHDEGRAILSRQLCPVLRDEGILKVLHDLTHDVIALERLFGGEGTLNFAVDTQVAHEALGGGMLNGFNATVRAFGGAENHLKDKIHWQLVQDPMMSSRRPLTPQLLNYAALNVIALLWAFENMQEVLFLENRWEEVVDASQMKNDFARKELRYGFRRVTFRESGICAGGDPAKALTTFELHKAVENCRAARAVEHAPPWRPNDPSSAAVLIKFASKRSREARDEDDVADVDLQYPSLRRGQGRFKRQAGAPAAASGDWGGREGGDASDHGGAREGVEDVNLADTVKVLGMVPPHFLKEQLDERCTENLKHVLELVMDEGSRPWADIKGKRVYLCGDESVVVTRSNVNMMVHRFETEKRFGADDRAGFDGQLHRLSVMRDRSGRIYGVTLRIGRFFEGSTDIIDDLLFNSPVSGPMSSGSEPNVVPQAPSILVLGRPGAGKTTAIREICRKLSACQTVVIVDTNNEIAGDGTVPHARAIGNSRRMMVPHTTQQHSVMIRALQNHTPQTIVVDEISCAEEAQACRDIKARGVRLVASAHGDLQSVLSNPYLNTLVGGKREVTLGDAMAEKNNRGDKVQVQRGGEPTFDMVIELERGQLHTWSVIKFVGRAVDSLLETGKYRVEKRLRLESDVSGDGSSEVSGSSNAPFLLGFATVNTRGVDKFARG